jgi:hypothetical protein
MSNPGERDDAHELEVETDVEEQGADGASSDEGDADGLGEESGEDGSDQGGEDPAGNHDGQAGQSAEVTGKPRSAATIAVQEAKRAAKEAKAEAEALRREMDQIRQQTQGRQTAEQEAAERARLELMPPEERMEHLLRKQEQGFNARFAQIQYQTWDANDRQSYHSACSDPTARGKALASVRDETERQAAQLRASGQAVPPRETIAAYLIGQRVLANGAKAVKKQADKGKENISRQTTKPGSGRGDVGGGNERRGTGTEADQRRDRLSNLQI